MRITRSAFLACAFATVAAGCRDDRTENISTGASDTALRAAGVDSPGPSRGWAASSEVSTSGEAIRSEMTDEARREALSKRSSVEIRHMARQRATPTRGTSSATSGGTRGLNEPGAGAGAHSSYPESDTGLDAGTSSDGGLPDQTPR